MEKRLFTLLAVICAIMAIQSTFQRDGFTAFVWTVATYGVMKIIYSINKEQQS